MTDVTIDTVRAAVLDAARSHDHLEREFRVNAPAHPETVFAEKIKIANVVALASIAESLAAIAARRGE